MSEIVHCRDCKYWTCRSPELLVDYPRDINPNWWYVDGYCDILARNLDIDSGDCNNVYSIKPDANFGCVLGVLK
jgi:hypothetical protein